MERGEKRYIWQLPDWPRWRYDASVLAPRLEAVSHSHGRLLGRLADVGLAVRDQASLAALTDDVLKTSEIEGEVLDVASVRSSIARRLGVDIGAVAPVDRHVEGVVEMVLDATSRATAPVTEERLLAWHAALFPTGYSGTVKIVPGQWRDDATGPMQVVSGPVGRRKVHFEAPPAPALPNEMARFLEWANATTGEPLLIKAGLAHLWFITLHPFDDGNGRMARAIADLFLARADGSPQRCYSLSAAIQRNRKAYYEVLENTQQGTLDVTRWLAWFLDVLGQALSSAHVVLDVVMSKARFWQRWGGTPLNERQVRVLNRLLDGFEGKLTSRKWAAITHCSPDTALRDITQLLALNILQKTAEGGRSTGYHLNLTGSHPIRPT